MARPVAPRGPVARAAAFLLNQGSALVGGQAVLEGVLMRIPSAYAVAVRTPKGDIRVKRELLPETARGRFGNLPLIRGSVILFKALMLGISALNFSAEVAIEEEEPGQETSGKPAKRDAKTTFALAMTVVFSLAAGVGLFFYVPLLLTQLAGKYWEVARGTFGFNLVDGAIRVVIFLAYIVLISSLKDIRRVFGYHGAEHKVVHTWEAREDLVVENARKYSVLHPRCGTSFLLFVMVISILVFSLIPHWAPFWMKAASRLIFLPLIAGLSYELIRLTAKFPCSWWSRPLLLPGLTLQRLTTREPDDSMLEVSLHALNQALELDRSRREAT